MICSRCLTDNQTSSGVCSGCAQPLLATPRLRTGSLVAQRYEIGEALGRGGMGTVYRARDRVLEEAVALKVMSAEMAESKEAIKRFRSEVKLARRVRHRNVCAIHDYGEDGGLLFIAMELIEGTDLRAVLRARGALPADEAWSAAVQIADGLGAIHDAGIMHRDLKTSNAMRDATGLVRLMDFGIAKEWGSAGLTAAGKVVGTPEYMSPEQIRGAPLDFRTDVYSLGILVFELFTARVPFQAQNPLDVLMMHLQTPPPLDGVSAAFLPELLRPLLARALAKFPEARTPSVAQLREELLSAWQASASGPAALADTVVTPLLAQAELLSAPSSPALTPSLPFFSRPASAPAPPALPSQASRADGSPVEEWSFDFEPARASVESLLEELSSADPQRRFHAANALGERGVEARDALPQLTQALRDGSTFVRAAAAMALKKVRGL